jgi:two-component system OmpR family sensor kinase
MFDSVRSRLTLWYVGVLALVLVAFSVTVYFLLAAFLYDRLDDHVGTLAEETGVSFIRKMKDGEPETKAAASALDEHVGPRLAAAIFDREGKLIADSPGPNNYHIQWLTPDFIPESGLDVYTLPADKASGVERRIGVSNASLDSPPKSYVVVISQSFDLVTSELKWIRLILFLTVPVALALAGLGGWFLARRSLKPVVEMTEQAHRISAENLEQRLPVVNSRDELGRLAATFNELLARLDDSFALQRRFMADASHELRTPISVMRTATDVTLEQERRSESEYRDALKVIDEQAHRLTRIVEDMFTLARADSGRRALQQNDFYLDELMLETARAAGVLADRKGVSIELDELTDIPFHGDEGLLRQMVLNLLDNAIKHTPPGGVVKLSLAQDNGDYDVIVSDTGVGIPPEAQSNIFERFYRVDKARSRASASDAGVGAGLGLAIAKWIAEAHKGQLKLQHSDQTGSTFVASLPSKAEVRG